MAPVSESSSTQKPEQPPSVQTAASTKVAAVSQSQTSNETNIFSRALLDMILISNSYNSFLTTFSSVALNHDLASGQQLVNQLNQIQIKEGTKPSIQAYNLQAEQKEQVIESQMKIQQSQTGLDTNVATGVTTDQQQLGNIFQGLISTMQTVQQAITKMSNH